MLAMAAMVAVVLLFLTEAPAVHAERGLAAVVFVIGVKLIDIEHMREIYRLRRDEFGSPRYGPVVVGVASNRA